MSDVETVISFCAALTVLGKCQDSELEAHNYMCSQLQRKSQLLDLTGQIGPNKEFSKAPPP